MTNRRNAIEPDRETDFGGWYRNLLRAAELAENSSVRGCPVLLPLATGLWRRIQETLDGMFEETGHDNVYFPLFIPKQLMEKEAEHVQGFAPECAIVTHTKLTPGADGGLQVAGPLEEPLIVRPTSEMLIGSKFSEWVQSYRDLPILINQWANVVRWEMRPRPFLRTAEFLWQEGHTAHATEVEARAETRQMLNIYWTFAEEHLAIPVHRCLKPDCERFPGAVATYSIESMTQDRKALQAGTSHYLGQNFARKLEISYQDHLGAEQFAHTTSWGVSTRLIGAVVMTHGDDDGLIVPPRIAPQHVIIIPVLHDESNRDDVLQYCDSVCESLRGRAFMGRPIRAQVDKRDSRGGEKVWRHIKRGAPLRIEVGPREVKERTVSVARRDQAVRQRDSLGLEDFLASVADTLADIQSNLYDRAFNFREKHTRRIDNLDEFRAFFTPNNREQPEIHGGFALCHWCDDPYVFEVLDELSVKIRGIPLDMPQEPGVCIFTGKPSAGRALFSKEY